MQTIVDLDLREVVSDFTVKSPAPPYAGKSQDTQSHEVYFVQGGAIQDLGTGPALKYGLIGPAGPSLLVLCTTYTRQIDAGGNVFYLGFPIFNTSNLASALGTNNSIACIAEIRYQLTTGEIEHTLDIPTTIFRTILSEITSDVTTAAFTTPAIGANVTIAIGSTAWLQIGQQITIATAGIYQVVSITDATHFVGQNTGQPGNAASGTVIASGSAVAGAPVNALTTYPPSNTLELISTRDVASGHAGLDAGTHLNPTVIPVDNVTIQILDGQVASSFILAETAASFVTPAANATVNVTLVSSTGLVVGQYVRLPIAGYYIVQSIPDGTHAVLQNNGDPFNVASGVTVPTDTPLLPAQAAAGGGSGTPGQNAYTLTSASFTVPPVGATVSVAMVATSWLGGSGYYVFITGAGYYAVNSITDSTHAVLTNAGGTSNAPPGTVVPTNTKVAASGLPGPTGASGAGLAAYDALASPFTMPAVSGTVTITIGNTAWISVNQIIYIASAGYLQVSAISSATQALITNLNYPGNATAGAVIASGSRVSPGGLQGPQGAGGPGLNAFTTLSANFTQPAINATVTVNVGSTTWMAAGQGIFIQGGGYYTVTSISDVTHAVVTNLGGTANPAAGSTIVGSGTQNVTPAGTPGVAGASAYTVTTASFAQPASGSTVTAAVGATSWMAQGQNLFIPGAGYYTVSVVTDAIHVVLNNSGVSGNASAGTTIPSGSQVSPAGSTGPAGPTGPQGPAGSGGGGGTSAGFDPRTGFYLYDDFLGNIGAGTITPEYVLQLNAGGQFNSASPYGYDTVRRALGTFELGTGVSNTSTHGGAITRGQNAASPSSLMLGFGVCEIAFRLAIEETTLPPTGITYTLRAGFYQQNTAGFPPTTGTLQRSIFLEYSPDNNGGNLRIGSGGASFTYINCSSAIPAANAFGWWSMKIDASGNVTAFLNGVQIGSGSGIAPVGAPVTPILLFYRQTGTTTQYTVCWDTLYINYPFAR